jgi:hypothetical protein
VLWIVNVINVIHRAVLHNLCGPRIFSIICEGGDQTSFYWQEPKFMCSTLQLAKSDLDNLSSESVVLEFTFSLEKYDRYT